MTETLNHGFAVNWQDDPEAPLVTRLKRLDKPLAPLKPGQMRVKMLASPVNPSDLVFLHGQYGIPPQDGLYAGFEGCGVVVEANAGLYGKWLKGRRVALSAITGEDGLWSRYALTNTTSCLPLRSDLSDVHGATLIVNPLTSVCLVERAMALKSKAVIVNAAASQVGKGVIRYAKQLGIKVIATVRSKANVDPLKALGAEAVLLTTDPDFKQQLKSAAKSHDARVLFDSVTGSDTAIILNAMPAKSTAIVYGSLAKTEGQLLWYLQRWRPNLPQMQN